MLYKSIYVFDILKYRRSFRYECFKLLSLLDSIVLLIAKIVDGCPSTSLAYRLYLVRIK